MEENEANEYFETTEEIQNSGEIENKSEIDELEDRYKRLLAEFENYKKRSQKERDSLYGMVTGDVVMTILPIMDNLEKAADAHTEDLNYQAGVKMVSKQLSEAFHIN